MNYLFYLGIIVPTLITIVLFLIFIYCWFLQKARKEVLTKKYDPHGKMRQMGMSMDPPPPPDYCRMDDSLLPEIGEDNIAYDVSRSPSTEQEGRGRPLYHTYHDSGISAGLSPSQESEPRPGLTYRTCPDSGISGFGPQPTTCSNCCHVQEQINRQQQPQQQQIHRQLYGDQVQIHAPDLQQRQYHQPAQQQQQLPQAVLHHNLVQASVHPTHGVCYGDDMTHPQSPQHYSHPPIHPATLSLGLSHFAERQNQLMALAQDSSLQTPIAHPLPQLSTYPYSPDREPHARHDQPCFHSSQGQDHLHNNALSPVYGRQSQDTVAMPIERDSQPLSRGVPSSSSGNFQSSLPANTSNHTNTQNSPPSSSSSSTQPLRHSYRDSGVSDVAQSVANNSADRPDSQASQSSTTDSEDSGFRSSHCTAHHNARLNKQGNPLLKPLRRTKNNKAKAKPPRTASSNSDDSTSNGATPLITLNPQNLPTHVDTSNVIQNTTLMELELAHRPPRIPRQNSIANGAASDNRQSNKSSPGSSPKTGPPMTFHDGSPVHASSACQHSPSRENWPPQSNNDQESAVKQNIDLNDISTHLSWKYLQDLSATNTNGQPSGSMPLQPCHGGLRQGQIHQLNQEQHMEMFGYSVV